MMTSGTDGTEIDLEYTPLTERLLRLPNTWTENATVEIAGLHAAIKLLQEQCAWLENELDTLRTDGAAVAEKVKGQGKKLYHVVRVLEAKGYVFG